MKSKYTFSEKDFVEFENCDYGPQFFFEALAFENGLFELPLEEHIEEGLVLELQFYKAYNARLRRETRRVQIATKLKDVQIWALKSLNNLLIDSGFVIRDEETEELFQEREYEILIRSFQ